MAQTSGMCTSQLFVHASEIRATIRARLGRKQAGGLTIHTENPSCVSRREIGQFFNINTPDFRQTFGRV